MQSESERSQQAYVTFADSQGADMAVLLSGTVIVDLPVSIIPVENYQLPPQAKGNGTVLLPESAVKAAEEVVSSVLAKGFVLGKGALNKANSLDERHQLLSSAAATVASLDRRIGLSQKINGTIHEVDRRLAVSDITRSAATAAEQGASAASAVILGNRHVSAGASWVSAALGKIVKAADDVAVMTREKMERAEEEQRELIHRQRAGIVSDFARIHLVDDSPLADEPAIVPVEDSGR
ncbi:binding partner of ACD11 1-like isoform X2 [Wolffia australiana]